jgi:N-acetylmuramic acid 6-phosphate etherase
MVHWRSRGYLPHLEGGRSVQVITVRLDDALPEDAIAQLETHLVHAADDERQRALHLRLDDLLDAGHGCCALRIPAVADLVETSLLHGDGERYRLLAWVVMPSHVHVAIEPLPGWDLDRIVHGWKSDTSHALRDLAPQAHWQGAYWNRRIQDAEHAGQTFAYILDNPVEAGLAERREAWRWSSAWDGYAPAGGMPTGRASSRRDAGAPGLAAGGNTAIPDRSSILTEQRNPRTAALHTLGVDDLVTTLLDENRAVLEALDAGRSALSAFVAAIEPGFARGGRLVYLGAGTSGRLGVLDASEVPPTFQMPPDRVIGIIAGGDGALRKSSEGAEDDPAGAVAALTALGLTCDDAVLGIAAGGTTPYVHGAIAWAKTLPSAPVTGLLSCAPVPAPPGCDHLIVLPTGPEPVTGSTRMKAGSATKMALNTISTALMVRLGKVHGNLMVDVRASNVKLRDRAARIIASLTGCERERCFALLDAAGGSVKTAVAMHHRACGRAEAEALLAAAGGRLDRVIP